MRPSAERAPLPTRADYVAWRTVTTRWRDDDAYGHLNNATYYELFDTAVNAHLFEATRHERAARLPQIGRGGRRRRCHFRRDRVPRDLSRTGTRPSTKVGTSSIVYRIGLFQGDSDEAAAEGRFVHVYVDNEHGAGQRPVVPMPDAVRAAVEPLLRP